MAGTEGVGGEDTRALALRPVSVIYVQVDEPAQVNRCPTQGGPGLLRLAVLRLHRMADSVDDLRRSLERVAR